MPLVIFFVPDPATGVAEMVRVVRPGGVVAAYAWDMPGGGFPYEPLLAEMRGLGIAIPMPPSPDASRMDVLRELWAGAGLEATETREITVRRTFSHFDDFWATALGAPSVGRTLAAMAAEDVALLKARLQARLPAGNVGLTLSARANAVHGRVPKVS
jgi:SAM-dependent methyltransferase